MKLMMVIGLVLLIGQTSVLARIVTKEIDYKAGDTQMSGFLAYDDAVTGKQPGILVVHEWWGLNDYPKFRAQELAKLGYVAFALDMYGKGKVTEDPKVAGEWAGAVKGNPEVARERGAAGLEILKQQPNVDPDKIGAIGYCFGGTIVLHMARANRPVKGVVSFHGDLSTAMAQPAKIEPKILVCHGAADPFVPQAQLDAFRKEMTAANADVKIIEYPDAQHAFTNSGVDKYKLNGATYNAEADKKSWQDMQAFFNALFAK